MFEMLDSSMLRGRGSYANPNSTIAMKDIPTNLKQIFRLCRFYYNYDALLRSIVNKMAEYPITDLVIKEHETKLTTKARKKWDDLLNVTLDLRRKMRLCNIDKFVFGQSFWYLYLPFVRYCTCKTCGYKAPIGTFKTVKAAPRMVGKKFVLTVRTQCPSKKCNGEREFDVQDRRSTAASRVTFVQLDPMRMELEANDVTETKRWYYSPSRRLRGGLLEGDRTIIDTTEMAMLEAAFLEQRILMNMDRLWVAQSDSLPGVFPGWGFPPLFSTLENVYYYKVLRRANEALAHEHATPMRVVSPAGTGDVSPQRTMNLTDWQNRLREEFFKFKKDPGHILLSPMPLNVEQIGGQARVMMLSAEMEAAAREIASGVGCPIELIWGGLNWTGASVSLRILENHFLNEIESSERMLKFLVPKLAAHFRLPLVEVSLSEFKMADDAAKQANSINMMLQGFLAREDVLPEMGFDPEQTFERLTKEHKRLNTLTMEDNIAASHMNTIITALEAKAQVLLQFELQLLQQNVAAQSERERLKQLNDHVQQLHQAGYTSPIEFDQSAAIIARLDPTMQNLIMTHWMQTMPNVSRLLLEKMKSQGIAMQDQALAGQAMGQGPAPLPNPSVMPGAAGGAGMAPGGQGPYSGGGGGEQADPGQAEPEQRPPTRGNPGL